MQKLQLFFNYRNMKEGPIYSIPLNFPEDIFALHNLAWLLISPPVDGMEVIATIAINPNSNNKHETKAVYVSVTSEPLEEGYYESYIMDEYKLTTLTYDYPDRHIEDWNSKVKEEKAKEEKEQENARRWDAIPEYKDPIVPIREFLQSPHMTASRYVSPNGAKTLVYTITPLANIEINTTSEGSPVRTGFATSGSFGKTNYNKAHNILEAWSRVAGLYDLVFTLNEMLRPKGINISATYGVDDDMLEIKVGLWDNGMYKYGFPFTSYYNCLDRILPLDVKYVAHVADKLKDYDDVLNAIQTIIRYVSQYMVGNPSITQAIKDSELCK